MKTLRFILAVVFLSWKRKAPTTCAALSLFGSSSVPCKDQAIDRSCERLDNSDGKFMSSRRYFFSCVNPGLAVIAAASLSVSPSYAADLKEEYRQGTAALGGEDEMAPVPREAYKKLPSGVVYADMREGNANSGVVKEGSRCNIQWVLRKSNGYFVDSSERNGGGVPFIFTVGDGSAIAGLDEAIRGMKEGGVRRLLIPPSLAYVKGLDDGNPGPLPNGFGPRQQMRRVQNVRKDVPGEYVFLEIQLTRLR